MFRLQTPLNVQTPLKVENTTQHNAVLATEGLANLKSICMVKDRHCKSFSIFDFETLG
jgi:hypothetical protein